jgi:hypothetical protein
MKLTNTSPYPDHVIRRVVAFACRQLEFPVRGVKKVVARTHGWSYSGRAYLYEGKITLRITHGVDFETFVYLVGHEVAHLDAYAREQRGAKRTRRGGRGSGGSEPLARLCGYNVRDAYLKNRIALAEEWWTPPAPRASKPKLSIQEKRHAAALKILAGWERKAALAKTKVVKYRKKVRYYEKVAATKGEQQ